MLEILKEIILDFQEEALETGIKRHLPYKYLPGKAFVCIGVRRCGKSTLLYQIIADLETQGVKRENILYLNFFDDRLHEIKQNNISLVLEAYFSIYPEKKGSEKIYCFFDELQEAADWEPFVDRILRTEKCSVFISGSSAKMLSKEIATQMRGRSLTWELFPFSFKEFLDFKRIDYEKLTSRNRLIIQKYFNEYLIKGGFPEVSDVEDKIRSMILQEYYKTILHRDIINRFDAIHPQAVVQAGFRLISSISSLYSINRITHHLKSMGYKVSKTFVSSCISWFEDAYFLFSVPIFSPSVSRQTANPKKIYCIDHALAGSVSHKILADKGHILENLIFVHLRRESEEIYYYKTGRNHEVDFVMIDSNKNKHLIQVCLSMGKPEENAGTFKRETRALFSAMPELGLDKGTIITMNEESVYKEHGRTINIIPAWKYLLQGISR
ncbi:MAG: ATP-binding protein [Deltaproteobacteria bacterium]|jgi:predicted AAA+ superfamily ATPase|nr:ATP-binding protein [Deltaproteobacteria bacterium]